MTVNKLHDPLKYKPRFTFDENAIRVMGPSSETVAQDMAAAFNRDVYGKLRAALIALGWAPPERIAELKASLRVMTIHATHGVGYLAPNHPDVVTARKLIKI